MKQFWISFYFLLGAMAAYGQKSQVFTHADTLRGTLSAERKCYDVFFYDLHLTIKPDERSIAGYNVIAFKAVTTFSRMQVDLFKNMEVDSIMHGSQKLSYTRDGNAMFIQFPAQEATGLSDSIKVFYHGLPQVAANPLWDGGFVWSKDSTGKTWVGVACEGTGASLWWPCKDHLSDKPDSMRMSFDVPDSLICVSNGRLRSEKKLNNGFTRFTWFVSLPIINYDVTLNIADYAHIKDDYESGQDTLSLDYFVLKYHEKKARAYFERVKPMMVCYAKYFGRYPFWKDGYKLVETNYWGMEHQSCVSYGNNYHLNNYGFDFIIVHESAHEWWGNNLSCSDEADMWLHESFATYAEALYLECTQGYKVSLDYLNMQRTGIENNYPIIGPYNVSFQGVDNDNDMYYKGAWVLQTFRHVLNNDSLFFSILKGLQEKFKYSSTNTADVVKYISKMAGKDYAPFFTQYLYYASPPVFDYKVYAKNGVTMLTYRWQADVKGFTMPIKVTSSVRDGVNAYTSIYPTLEWQTITLGNVSPAQFSTDKDDFYTFLKDESQSTK